MNQDVIKKGQFLNFLLVEGKDDEHVFYSLLEHYQVPERFKIKNKEGIDRLLETLDVEIDQSGLERLGIVVDADTDIVTRWQSLRNILINCGYSGVPVTPAPNGTILIQENRPVVGIWLMPDNEVAGMLENFVSFLVPVDDLLWPMAGEIVRQVMEKDCRPFCPRD